MMFPNLVFEIGVVSSSTFAVVPYQHGFTEFYRAILC